MNLSKHLKSHYTEEHLSAAEAQRLAHFISFGPAVFQTARIMIDRGILQLLNDSAHGLTLKEIEEKTGLSEYAVKCLLEASLSIGIVKVDADNDRYLITKTGWFVLNDKATRANIDFNHHINYRGWFHLEEALTEGKPSGLKTLGDWDTIYEGLSSLRPEEQSSWFGFDHFYSDSSFPEALEIVFSHQPKKLLDVGGNTGRWALQCVENFPEAKVTILDLPQQIEMMRKAVDKTLYADRIDGIGLNILKESPAEKTSEKFDAIWMSQFLDCFGRGEIVKILNKMIPLMEEDSRIYIMETFWDRQRFEPSAFCLTMTSLYFTAMANGNSKMYHSDDFFRLVEDAGLEIEEIHDNIGYGHTILVCKKKN